MEKVNSDYIYSWVKWIFNLTVVIVVFLIALTIIFQKDLRGVESNVIYSVQLILESNNLLYESPELPPFNITQYSPLYYIISDGVIGLLPIEPDNYFAIRVVTRVISIVLLILSLYVINDTLQRVIGVKKRASLIITLVFLIISFPWFNISRPDVLLLLFFTLSIRSILLFLQNEKNWIMAILFGVCMALGLLSKLTMLFYIMAFGLYIIIAKKWKLAFLSGFSFVVSLMLIGSMTHLLGYDITFLYDNIFKGVDNGTSIVLAWYKAYKNYFSYFGLFSLVFVLFSLVYLKNWKEIKTNSNLLFLIIISYIIAIFSFVSALKVGSAIHYFNELLLCITLFMASFLNSYHATKKKLYLIGFMLLGISITINHTFRYAPQLFNNLVQLSTNKEREKEIPKIVDFLKLNLDKGYFYSENKDIALSFPQRCILFPTDIHGITYEREIFNYSLVEEWAKENLSFIIVSPNTMELYGIDIKKYYSLKTRYPNYDLYELTSNNN